MIGPRRPWMRQAHPKKHDDLRALLFVIAVLLVILAASSIDQGSLYLPVAWPAGDVPPLP